ncbi:MAG: hypothetical protein JOZ31_06720 [Verrucomicrobia bacterium]|nr:hypothetical protein [Verrucomicrobiota bacterium]
MPDSSPQNIDIAKLHELLKDTKKQEEIGHEVLKAVIIDVLRSKASGDVIPWILRYWGGFSCVIAALQKIVDDVSLTEAERRILKELESEEKKGDSPSGGKT